MEGADADEISDEDANALNTAEGLRIALIPENELILRNSAPRISQETTHIRLQMVTSRDISRR